MTVSPPTYFALRPHFDPVELARMELAVLEHAKTLVRHAIRPGTLLAGRYLVERILSRDPHGVLVSAMHEGCGKAVEIRVVTRTHASPARIERFQREARLLARLESRHVAKILDVGRLPSGAVFLVRERVEGRSVAETARARGGLPVGEAMAILSQVGEAVAEAHLHGVVLRDLQPRHVRLDAQGNAVICDLGACAILCDTRDASDLTQRLATSATAAPEVLRGEEVDARADLWSLGCLLYELLTGQPAFVGEGAALLAAITNGTPAPLAAVCADVPHALQRVIDWTLRKSPAERPAGVRPLFEALLSHDHEPASPRRPARTRVGAPLGPAPG